MNPQTQTEHKKSNILFVADLPKDTTFDDLSNFFKNYHFQFATLNNSKVSNIWAQVYFEDDICSDEAFDEGVLIVPVHTRGFTNCDLFFDKVFADDTGHVDHFKNFSKFKYYAEVCDVVNNRKTGRENDKERILAYNIGISTHDIYFAGKIYQLFKDDTAKFNRLADLDLHDPATKFWV